jgi:cyanamide hydratase
MTTVLDPVTTYGLTAVPSSCTTLFNGNIPGSPPFIPTTQTPVPSTPLANRIDAYARSNLSEQTYHHSLRVYHFGLAIKRHAFPTWSFTDETYFLACLLHDLGTTDKNTRKTRLSFEFYGGFLALEVLQSSVEHPAGQSGDGTGIGTVAPREQAESVAEAIIRHQDVCEKGMITALGQLLQLATLLDNTGANEHLVNPQTIEDVCANYPRKQWSSCFAGVIRKENGLKPWAHSTTLGEEEFPAKIMGNKLMSPYE